jgi:hypothetical protein
LRTTSGGDPSAVEGARHQERFSSRLLGKLVTKKQFAAWRTRDLSEVELDYLFVDASHFKMHDDARSEPVLVAYGVHHHRRPGVLAPGWCVGRGHRRLRRVLRGHGCPRPGLAATDDL